MEDYNATSLTNPNCSFFNISDNTLIMDCVQSPPEQYPVPLGIIILLCTLYGAISLISVVGNTLVIWVVASSHSMQNVTNFFIANLAVSDVTIAIFCIPFQFYAALLQRWDWPEFMCKFCPFAQILSVNVSIFTLVAISLDRYKAIMQPLSEKTSKFWAKMAIVIIWILSMVLAIPNLYFFQLVHQQDQSGEGLMLYCTAENVDNIYIPIPVAENENHTNYTSQNDNSYTNTASISWFKIYNIVLMILQYAIPLMIISFAYTRMGIKLWLTHTPGNAHDQRDERILINKKKFIKMLSLVVILFCICWLPYHAFQLFPIIWPHLLQIAQFRYIPLVFFACHWLAMSNSCYNPFIYAIYSEKFKSEFKERVFCNDLRRLCCPRLSNPEDEELALGAIPISQRTNGMEFQQRHHQITNISTNQRNNPRNNKTITMRSEGIELDRNGFTNHTKATHVDLTI